MDRALIPLILMLAIPSAGVGRTWTVAADGTGDAATISAAMDSAVVADTVLVEPGEYQIGTVDVQEGVVFLAAEGPLVTTITHEPFNVLSGLSCAFFTQAGTVIDGFWFDNLAQQSLFPAITMLESASITVRNCVFTDNAIGVYNDATYVNLRNNTFFNNGFGISAFGPGSCLYNIIWDQNQNMGSFAAIFCNDLIDITNIPIFQRRTNFSLDPQFCDATAGDFRLQATSPCAPPNLPDQSCMEVFGALSTGCGPTPTDERTWGRIKYIYR